MFIVISSVKLSRSPLKLSGLVQRSEMLPDAAGFGCGLFWVFFLVLWLVVFLPSPAVLYHLGQGKMWQPLEYVCSMQCLTGL